MEQSISAWQSFVWSYTVTTQSTWFFQEIFSTNIFKTPIKQLM